LIIPTGVIIPHAKGNQIIQKEKEKERGGLKKGGKEKKKTGKERGKNALSLPILGGGKKESGGQAKKERKKKEGGGLLRPSRVWSPRWRGEGERDRHAMSEKQEKKKGALLDAIARVTFKPLWGKGKKENIKKAKGKEA